MSAVPGLLAATQYHCASYLSLREFLMVVEKNRPAIVCDAVKVAFVTRRILAAAPVKSFNNPRRTVLVSTVEEMAVDLFG